MMWSDYQKMWEDWAHRHDITWGDFWGRVGIVVFIFWLVTRR